VFLTSAKIDTAGYDLELGFVPDCQGQHVCFYGSSRGSVARFDPPGEWPVRVQLVNGIQGLFSTIDRRILQRFVDSVD
jgi:hypothetical protein